MTAGHSLAAAAADVAAIADHSLAGRTEAEVERRNLDRAIVGGHLERSAKAVWFRTTLLRELTDIQRVLEDCWRHIVRTAGHAVHAGIRQLVVVRRNLFGGEGHILEALHRIEVQVVPARNPGHTGPEIDNLPGCSPEAGTDCMDQTW